MGKKLLNPLAVTVAVSLAATCMSRADFTAYTNGQANSTYAHYANFLNCDGTYPGPFTNADLGTFHPLRIPDVRLTELTGAGFVTGSGNIYSPDFPTEFSVIIPSYNRVGFSTFVWLQWRTLGSELDYDGITLTYKDDIGNQTLTLTDAAEVVEISREPGQFGGFDVEYLVKFDVPYNPRTLTARFNAAESSMSLDQFRVDTLAYPTP